MIPLAVLMVIAGRKFNLDKIKHESRLKVYGYLLGYIVWTLVTLYFSIFVGGFMAFLALILVIFTLTNSNNTKKEIRNLIQGKNRHGKYTP